ncbi:hypothetical protein ACFP2T_24565 [Plantactinospora solaniradicis]|uniref:Uncharacterized protein n=1 Tax=Plantactinospora solaniradicis TaxID=1723736 RepID=A0ABW1KC37_9ACTN
MTYQAVPLPAGTGSAGGPEIVAGVHGWISSRPMADLVAAFGAELPGLGTADLLAWLDEFSAEHWDFRRREAERRAAPTGTGVERDQVVGVDFTPAVAALVRSAARALGLVGAAPVAHRSYDHVVVLGGRAPACLQRTAYAAQLIRGGLTAGTVAALGSFRVLGGHELAVLGEPAEFEVDAMEIGIRRAFGIERPARRRGSTGAVERTSWRVYRHAYGPGRPLEVLAAPAETGGSRANTPDTYRFWARNVSLTTGDRVLVVTTPLYVPFQHCDALRILHGYGCAVQTVGFAATAIGAAPVYESPAPDRYLQEIRSGIRSMRDLVRSLDAG